MLQHIRYHFHTHSVCTLTAIIRCLRIEMDANEIKKKQQFCHQKTTSSNFKWILNDTSGHSIADVNFHSRLIFFSLSPLVVVICIIFESLLIFMPFQFCFSHFMCILTMHCAVNKQKKKTSSLVNCLSNGVKIVIIVNIYCHNICTFLYNFFLLLCQLREFSEFISEA